MPRPPGGPRCCAVGRAPGNRCQAWLWLARSRRTWLIWLMITWAEASMAWATGLDGSRSWAAIWAADRPARTCGLYWAPAITYWLAMSRKGTAPDWSALLT